MGRRKRNNDMAEVLSSIRKEANDEKPFPEDEENYNIFGDDESTFKRPLRDEMFDDNYFN